MKRIHDNGPGCAGRIKVELIDAQGAAHPFVQRSNTVTYGAADLMARVLSGDATYLPTHIGFMYGTEYSPLLDDPDTLPVATRRMHDWAAVGSDVAAINGNIAVVPFTMAPSLSRDGDSGLYTANAVTFTGHTGMVQEYGFATTGSTYAADLDTLESSYPGAVYFYHVVLLNRWQSGTTITYTPFARAALGQAPFTPKPADFELSVYWTISYK
jgi:hypothetical protein